MRRLISACPLTVAVVAVAAIATGLFLGNSEIAGALVATREGLVAGELWRLASGPFVHGTVEHLLRDTLSLLALGLFAERTLGRLFLAILAVSLVVPTLVVLLVPPVPASYFGLSGAVHALLVAFLVRGVCDTRGFVRCLLATGGVAYVANLAFEMATGGLFFPHTAGADLRPMPLAHLVGAIIGVAAFLLARGRPQVAGDKRSISGRETALPFAAE